MANKIVTFTTYKTDETTESGTPFVFGFTDKSQNNYFDNTGDSVDADLEIPPPPPPGSASTGNPISTSYIDSMYVKVNDGTNDINAYQYFIDISDNNDIALDLAVRDYGGDNVVFKYNHTDISGVLGTLNITNGDWIINLVDSSVSGTGPSVTENGDERTVTLPHLGNDLFYTMNLKQYEAVSGPTEVTQTISLNVGWTWACFYVDLTDTTLDNLSNENVAGGCVIKAKIGNPASARYYVTDAYTGWFPTALDSNVWKNGISFQFNNPSQNSATISLTNTIPSTIDLTLSPGWNWIGFINSEEKTIVDVIPNGKPGYFIKRKTGNPSSAAYYVTDAYTGWFPINLPIIPGEGYQFNLYSDVFSSNETITISN
jgi:hypothetical protein